MGGDDPLLFEAVSSCRRRQHPLHFDFQTRLRAGLLLNLLFPIRVAQSKADAIVDANIALIVFRDYRLF